MKVVLVSHRSSESLPPENATVCLGMFDGLHRGHLFLLSKLKEYAESSQTQSAVITFASHPARLLRNIKRNFLLASPREREERLRATKFVDCLYVFPFEESIASLSPETFLDKWVFPSVNVYQFVVGHDFHFGHNRSGNVDTLIQLARKKKFKVIPIKEHVLEQGAVSSTKIRKMLQSNEIEKANSLLGYDYMLRGIVVHGKKKGKELGFPTANIKLEDEIKLLPQRGVYATEVEVRNERYVEKRFIGMMNVGVRPTVSSEEKEIAEVHILGFSDDIYGVEIVVFVKRFIREEKKFDSLELLLNQLKKDKKWVETHIKKLPRYS